MISDIVMRPFIYSSESSYNKKKQFCGQFEFHIHVLLTIK